LLCLGVAFLFREEHQVIFIAPTFGHVRCLTKL
jgi:hypothetical protein